MSTYELREGLCDAYGLDIATAAVFDLIADYGKQGCDLGAPAIAEEMPGMTVYKVRRCLKDLLALSLIESYWVKAENLDRRLGYKLTAKGAQWM